MNRSHAQSGGWFRFDFLSGRSPLPTFWLFIVVGLMMSFGFGVTAIWRASQAPLDSARDDFVVMQNRLIEDWIDYQIAGYISGLRYLASKPLVISTVVGESQSNHALDDLISQFDLLPSLTHIEIIDVLGERLATRSVDPAWYGVYTGLELLDTASSQLETPDVIVGTRLSFENNIILISVPVLYLGNVEGAVGCVVREDVTQPSNFRSIEGFTEWMAANGKIGLSGVDTRALTRRIRLITRHGQGIINTKLDAFLNDFRLG